VNFSSFVARCIESGINDKCPGRCEFSRFDIVEALEKPLPPGVIRDSWVMVAAQYILLAGRVIDEEFFKIPAKGNISEWWGRGRWRLWARRFKTIANDMEDKGSELNSAINKVYKKMISFHPEEFFVSEGGSKPDPKEMGILIG
jgi:Protein of unknown function (DUF3632)